VIELTYQEDSQFCAVEVTEEIAARFNQEVADAFHGAIGISGEVSEIHEAFYNANFLPDKIDTVNLQEELGDICWYIANMCTALKYDANWALPQTKVEQSADEGLDNFLLKSIKMSVISGNIMDAFKRKIYYNVELDKGKLIDWLNQLIKLVYGMAENLKIALPIVQQKNVDKLRERFGEKFSEHAASNRNLEAEREILEKN